MHAIFLSKPSHLPGTDIQKKAMPLKTSPSSSPPAVLSNHLRHGSKQWTALLNPYVFLIISVEGLKPFSQVFAYLAPESINKGNVAMFALATVSMWNGESKKGITGILKADIFCIDCADEANVLNQV